MRLTEDEVLSVLEAIDRGELTLNTDDVIDAKDNFCGDFAFRVSNGWLFVIFNDCDQWDYIQTVTAPDGRTLDFDDIWGPAEPDAVCPMPRLKAFAPKSEAWGITP